jgi:drug/metabolite transporter (DMT)-like permease
MPEVISGLDPNKRFFIVIKFAILISLVEAFSQFNLKNNTFIFGILGYICVALILYNSYHYENMGHMNLVWSCTSIIICYIISHIFFNEHINKYTFYAIILAISAIYFAHRSDENC